MRYPWMRAGRFEYDDSVSLTVMDHGSYMYTGDRFLFVRPGSTVIHPRPQLTDLGTIPRLLWSIPGFDPAYYAREYLLHDAMWQEHFYPGTGLYSAGYSFEDTATILAEAMYTRESVWNCGQVPESALIRIKLIYEGVSSSIARAKWDK